VGVLGEESMPVHYNCVNQKKGINQSEENGFLTFHIHDEHPFGWEELLGRGMWQKHDVIVQIDLNRQK